MVCDMPNIPGDDEVAMARAKPVCHVAEPAKMDCKTSDFFSTGMGGPLHTAVLGGDFDKALSTWDGYNAAERRVTRQQRVVDTIKEHEKRAAKHYAAVAKRAKFENDYWLTPPRSNMPTRCWSKLEYWKNATERWEKEVKADFKGGWVSWPEIKL